MGYLSDKTGTSNLYSDTVEGTFVSFLKLNPYFESEVRLNVCKETKGPNGLKERIHSSPCRPLVRLSRYENKVFIFTSDMQNIVENQKPVFRRLFSKGGKGTNPRIYCWWHELAYEEHPYLEVVTWYQFLEEYKERILTFINSDDFLRISGKAY
jgi:hypothetical protein